eukprot:scaffold60476_cov118-Cyclotella_meneghiniana.AAC.1
MKSHQLDPSNAHHMYNEWLDKVKIGIHHPQPSPHPDFRVTGGDNFVFLPLMFHTKIERVWTDSSNSHQLDPSNVSLYV